MERKEFWFRQKKDRVVAWTELAEKATDPDTRDLFLAMATTEVERVAPTRAEAVVFDWTERDAALELIDLAEKGPRLFEHITWGLENAWQWFAPVREFVARGVEELSGLWVLLLAGLVWFHAFGLVVTLGVVVLFLLSEIALLMTCGENGSEDGKTQPHPPSPHYRLLSHSLPLVWLGMFLVTTFIASPVSPNPSLPGWEKGGLQSAYVIQDGKVTGAVTFDYDQESSHTVKWISPRRLLFGQFEVYTHPVYQTHIPFKIVDVPLRDGRMRHGFTLMADFRLDPIPYVEPQQFNTATVSEAAEQAAQEIANSIDSAVPLRNHEGELTRLPTEQEVRRALLSVRHPPFRPHVVSVKIEGSGLEIYSSGEWFEVRRRSPEVSPP